MTHLPTLAVPHTSGPRCESPSPATLKPCKRAKGHQGRHYFAWVDVRPPAFEAGRVREVWESSKPNTARDSDRLAAQVKTAPAGNRGLTATTAKES